MAVIPSSHIADSQLLTADGRIDLYQLDTSDGSGSIYFKPDNDVTWLGINYTGLPVSMAGEAFNAEGGQQVNPTLTIGQPNLDLSAFKPLIFTGAIDNARVTKYTVLLTNLQANVDIKETRVYRVKRIEAYSASGVTLTLATFSAAGPTTLPFRQYVPPAFPFVVL